MADVIAMNIQGRNLRAVSLAELADELLRRLERVVDAIDADNEAQFIAASQALMECVEAGDPEVSEHFRGIGIQALGIDAGVHERMAEALEQEGRPGFADAVRRLGLFFSAVH